MNFAPVLEHPDIVGEFAPAVEQALHRDRPREVILQHLARHGPVERIVAGTRDRGRRSRHGCLLLGESPAGQGPCDDPEQERRRPVERAGERRHGRPLSPVLNMAGVLRRWKPCERQRFVATLRVRRVFQARPTRSEGP